MPAWFHNTALGAESLPQEPLMLFEDLSALQRSWVQLSGFQPFRRGYPTVDDEMRNIVTFFSHLILMGDTWNKHTGKFSFGEHWDADIISNDTHIFLPKLRRSLEQTFLATIEDFRAAYETRVRSKWYKLAHKALSYLKSEAWDQALRDPRKLSKEVDSEEEEDKSKEETKNGLPAHIDPVKALQNAKDVLDSYSMTGYVEDNAEISQKARLLADLRKLLPMLETVQNIVAHTSTGFLLEAQMDERWVKFPLFNRISAEWHKDSPLFKAHQHAENLGAVSSERSTLQGFVGNVHAMVVGLEQIITCETALKQQVDGLLATTRARARQGNYASIPGRNYTWVPSLKAWVTSKEFNPDLAQSDVSHGLDQCAPLYEFDQEALAKPSYWGQGEIKRETHPPRRVLEYIPYAAHLHEGLERDLQWSQEFRADLLGRGLVTDHPGR